MIQRTLTIETLIRMADTDSPYRALPVIAEAWADSGMCAQVDPELFFPEKGGSTREAKRICSTCPVQPQCLEAALNRREPFGIWGGASEHDRRVLMVERGIIPKPIRSGHTREYAYALVDTPCEPCGRVFKSRHAHRVHLQCAVAHQRDRAAAKEGAA